jgi:hypothetical protein
VKIVLDAGVGDVDHEDVEERHERGRQDDRESLPTAGGVVGYRRDREEVNNA